MQATGTSLCMMMTGTAHAQEALPDGRPVPFSKPIPRVEPTDQSRWAVKTPEEASKRAVTLLFGAEPPPHGEITADLARLSDDQSPYFGGGLRARDVWRVRIPATRLRVTFKSRGLDPKTGEPTDISHSIEDAVERTVTAAIDPMSGNLWRVDVAHGREVDAGQAPAPVSQASAEAQMRAHGPEVWTSAPGVDPKVVLMGALSAVAANGYEVFTGGRVEAHYVAWRYAGKDTRNVWSIHIFGTTPRRFRPGVAPAARSHLRHIVDATTGDWVLSTTVPQPDEPTPRLDGKNDVPIPAPGGNAAPGGGG
jgi:hypothetical protein